MCGFLLGISDRAECTFLLVTLTWVACPVLPRFASEQPKRQLLGNTLENVFTQAQLNEGTHRDKKITLCLSCCVV